MSIAPLPAMIPSSMARLDPRWDISRCVADGGEAAQQMALGVGGGGDVDVAFVGGECVLRGESGEHQMHVGVYQAGDPAPSATHCQGWLLCNDGARHANCTAALSMSTSTKVSGMINLRFVFESILGGWPSLLVPV